ncbi:hypothetical protein GBF38_005375 [Nibea albiflora]|uniref:Uncharacterized protein n=1 Tax=Nibea albiflora TaxID=240163 RepID=A0ACB7EW74_NIBAL|nr:hypothetical protein GBF38_005375 [Nibea albiflora]
MILLSHLSQKLSFGIIGQSYHELGKCYLTILHFTQLASSLSALNVPQLNSSTPLAHKRSHPLLLSTDISVKPGRSGEKWNPKAGERNNRTEDGEEEEEKMEGNVDERERERGRLACCQQIFTWSGGNHSACPDSRFAEVVANVSMSS